MRHEKGGSAAYAFTHTPQRPSIILVDAMPIVILEHTDIPVVHFCYGEAYNQHQ